MSYYDKKFGGTLPTRHGGSTGAANERQMLDRLGGSEGYRKQIRLNPDGSTTMLTTKNGKPQFTTSTAPDSVVDDGNLFLGMDSGALQATKSTQATYTRTGKNKIPPNEKAGFVHWIDNSLEGKQPNDNSTTDAAGADSNLIRGCPASMFTGRTRLYVQCLYGRLTSSKNAAGVTVSHPPPDISLVETFGIAPYITINNVPVDTSTGLYFDSAAVEHYLVNITTAKAYKLKRTVNVDRLVKLIQNKLTPDEKKEKAEAYILAHSVPDTSKVMPLALPARPASAFGYGWHFDWLGKQCDLVQVISGLSNTSVHHTIRISLANGVITTSHSQVVGPSWKNKRLFNVLAFPVWDLSGYMRVGQPYDDSNTEGTPQPFYVYHERLLSAPFPGDSKIILCTFSARPETKAPAIVKRVPPYLNPGAFWTLGDDDIDYVTNGTSGTSEIMLGGGANKGFLQSYSSGTTTKASKPVTSSTALGSVTWFITSVFVPEYNIETGRPVGPSMISDTTVPPFGTISAYGGEGAREDSVNFSHLYFNYAGSEERPPPVIHHAATNFPATWSTEETSDDVTDEVKTIAVPPYYDAEAIVYYMQLVKKRHRVGSAWDCSGVGHERGYAFGSLDNYPTSLATTYHTYTKLLNALDRVSTSAVDTTDITTETWARATGSFGSEDITMPDVGRFFGSGEDPVPSYIPLRSSVAKSVYSAELSLNLRNEPAAFAGKWHTYVGWA